MQIEAEVLFIKVGKVTTTKLENQKREELVSAIKKYPVQNAYLTKTGFKEDEQADLRHHGGENKALFLFAKTTYEKINKECKTEFEIDGVSHFGENLILSNIDEKTVCIGDIYKVGEAIIQITQPRQPCWKLSANTNKKEMTKFIFNSGLTGWYAKVIKEGVISKHDKLVLEQRVEDELTISVLNKLILNPYENETLSKKALASEVLGKQFLTSLEKRYKDKDADKQFEIYHS